MLSPEYILHVSEAAEKAAEELHDKIVQAIVRRIMQRLGRGESYLLTAQDKWQLEVLQGAGFLMEDLQAEIAATVRQRQATVKRAFEDAGVRAISYDDSVYKAAGLEELPLQQSPYLIRILQRDYEKTTGLLRNLTGTMASAAQQTFIRECDTAYRLVMSGAVSYTQAVKDAVNTVAKDGVVVTYPSGHRDTIETATLRAVRTGVAQACGEITTARMYELDWDTVLVSAHLGARIGDEGENAGNHAWWQGKFYSRSGADPRFPPFSVCGFGTGEGLCGYNCRHSFGPGDGEHNPYQDYDSAENKRAYEISQKQRAMERAIRKTKREVKALREAADFAQDETLKQSLTQDYRAKAKRLQEQNAAYRAFSEANGLKTQQDRLSIAGWGRSDAAKATAAARQFTSGVSGGILEAVTPKALQITDDAIERVPLYTPEGWTPEQAVALQQAHKDLLRRVQQKPAGTEASATYDMSMRPLQKRTGKDAANAVAIPDEQVPYLAAHNHPDGLTFSENDVAEFIGRTNLRLLAAVGNDGALYVVEKTQMFDKSAFSLAFLRYMQSRPEMRKSAAQYAKGMADFLKGGAQYGIRYYGGRNR